jgi:hypothetical protein
MRAKEALEAKKNSNNKKGAPQKGGKNHFQMNG